MAKPLTSEDKFLLWIAGLPLGLLFALIMVATRGLFAFTIIGSFSVIVWFMSKLSDDELRSAHWQGKFEQATLKWVLFVRRMSGWEKLVWHLAQFTLIIGLFMLFDPNWR